MLLLFCFLFFSQLFMGDQDISNDPKNKYLENRALSKYIKKIWSKNEDFFFPYFYKGQKSSIKGDTLRSIIEEIEKEEPISLTENVLSRFMLCIGDEKQISARGRKDLLLKLGESPSSVPRFALPGFLCSASGFEKNNREKNIGEDYVNMVNESIKLFINNEEQGVSEPNPKESEYEKIDVSYKDALEDMKKNFKSYCNEDSFNNLVLDSIGGKKSRNENPLWDQKIGSRNYRLLTTPHEISEKVLLIQNKFISFVNKYNSNDVTYSLIHDFVKKESELFIHNKTETVAVAVGEGNEKDIKYIEGVKYSTPSISNHIIAFLKRMEPFGICAEMNLEQASKEWEDLNNIIKKQKENKGLQQDGDSDDEEIVDECAIAVSYGGNRFEKISFMEAISPMLFPIFSMSDSSLGQENWLLSKLKGGVVDMDKFEVLKNKLCGAYLPKNNVPYFNHKKDGHDDYILHKKFGVAMSQCYQVGDMPSTPFDLCNPLEVFDNRYKVVWTNYEKACLNAELNYSPLEKEEKLKDARSSFMYSLSNLLTELKSTENNRYNSGVDRVLFCANLEKIEKIQNGKNQFVSSHYDRAHQLHMILFSLFYLYDLEVKISVCQGCFDGEKNDILKDIAEMVNLLEDCFILAHIQLSDYLNPDKQKGIYGLFKNEINQFKIEYQNKLKEKVNGIISSQFEGGKYPEEIDNKGIEKKNLNSSQFEVSQLVESWKKYQHGIWVEEEDGNPVFKKIEDIAGEGEQPKLDGNIDLDGFCEVNKNSQDMGIHRLSDELNALTINEVKENLDITTSIENLYKNFVKEEIFKLLWPMYNGTEAVDNDAKQNAQKISSEKVKFLNNCISLFVHGELKTEERLTLLKIMENHMRTAMSDRYDFAEWFIKGRSQRMSDKYEILKQFKELQESFLKSINSLKASGLEDGFKIYLELTLKSSMNEIYNKIKENNYGIHFYINNLKELMKQIQNTIEYKAGNKIVIEFSFSYGDYPNMKQEKKEIIFEKNKFDIKDLVTFIESLYFKYGDRIYFQLFGKLESFFGDGFNELILDSNDGVINRLKDHKYKLYFSNEKDHMPKDKDAYFQEYKESYNKKKNEYIDKKESTLSLYKELEKSIYENFIVKIEGPFRQDTRDEDEQKNENLDQYKSILFDYIKQIFAFKGNKIDIKEIFKDIFNSNCNLLGVTSFLYNQKNIDYMNYEYLYNNAKQYRERVKYLYAVSLTIKGLHDFVSSVKSKSKNDKKDEPEVVGFLDDIIGNFEDYIYSENNLFDKILCYNKEWNSWDQLQPELKQLGKDKGTFNKSKKNNNLFKVLFQKLFVKDKETFNDNQSKKFKDALDVSVLFKKVNINYWSDNANVVQFKNSLATYDIKFDAFPVVEDNNSLSEQKNLNQETTLSNTQAELEFKPIDWGENWIRALKIFLYGCGMSTAVYFLVWLYNHSIINSK